MSIRTVLAATDLRSVPDHALDNAARLAGMTGAELHAFHCLTTGWPETGEAGAGARRELAERAASAKTAVVSAGTPYLAIRKRAVEVGADVIVLGPRRRHRGLGVLLGSTADRVLRTTRVPCLLSAAVLPPALALILVPVDASQHARRAVHLVTDLVEALGRRGVPLPTIHLLHVSAFAEPGAPGMTGLVRPGRIAQRVAGKLGQTARVTHETYSAPFVSDGILSCSDALQPDLLVMGTHGDGPFVRALIGSAARDVAESVLRPVLLVPRPGRRSGARTD